MLSLLLTPYPYPNHWGPNLHSSQKKLRLQISNKEVRPLPGPYKPGEVELYCYSSTLGTRRVLATPMRVRPTLRARETDVRLRTWRTALLYTPVMGAQQVSYDATRDARRDLPPTQLRHVFGVGRSGCQHATIPTRLLAVYTPHWARRHIAGVFMTAERRRKSNRRV